MILLVIDIKWICAIILWLKYVMEGFSILAVPGEITMMSTSPFLAFENFCNMKLYRIITDQQAIALLFFAGWKCYGY